MAVYCRGIRVQAPKLFKELEKERDAYRRELCLLARGLFSEAELQTIPATTDGVPLEDFLAELEQAIKSPA